jgi:hypothetical protein
MPGPAVVLSFAIAAPGRLSANGTPVAAILVRVPLFPPVQIVGLGVLFAVLITMGPDRTEGGKGSKKPSHYACGAPVRNHSIRVEALGLKRFGTPRCLIPRSLTQAPAQSR